MNALYSQIVGKGKPLVILHGFLGMGDNWKTLANQFAEAGYEVHLVDQRNHGRSFHSDAFDYGVMADDLKNYCMANDLEPIVLLGHSMGGKTAMEFATRYPSMVAKLIVADIAPKAYPQHHQDILKGLSSLDFEQIQSRSEADEALSQYVKDFGTRQFLLKNLYWVAKGKLGLRMNLPVLSEQVEEVGKPLEKTQRFERDALFVRGEKSSYILPEDEWLISRHFPKAKIDTVSGAGHWLHADNPSEFYEKIMNFLTGFSRN